MYKNTKIVLKSRPEGFPTIDNFSITEEEISATIRSSSCRSNLVIT